MSKWEDYSYLPITRPHLEAYYRKQRDVFWTAQEISYAQDRLDFASLSSDERRFVKFVLAFFAQADGVVNENLIERFQRETRIYKEAGHFYIMQAMIELIHNETYSLLVEALIDDPDERVRILNGVQNYPAVRKIAEWMVEWMQASRPLTERIVAFACVEGIIFSSAFASIYWIKRKNVLPGVCKANEFIARDEAIHTIFAVALYHEMTGRDKIYPVLDASRVRSIIDSAVKVTEEFTRDALRVDLVGMNADDMMKYVKCTANRLSESLGCERIYDAENPFLWITVIGLPNKSNYFETKVSEYTRHGVGDFEFDLKTDF